MDIYSPAVLTRVIDDLRDSNNVGTFLVNRFFPEVVQSNTEEVYFDVKDGKARLSPFVSPMVEGQIVQSRGYTTKSLRPAYIKDKRVMEDGKSVRRPIGMPIAQAMDPMTQRLLNIRAETEDQIRMVNRRKEWMAASALLNGTITITGEKYPTVVVNFGRDAALSVVLAGAARWNDSAPDVLGNLETWASLVRSKSGAPVRDVIMANGTWTALRNSEDVKELLRYDRSLSPESTIDLGPSASMPGVTYKGQIGEFRFWIYSDFYVDDAGNEQAFIPDGYLLLVSEQLEGVQHYGGIKDEQAGFKAMDYFSKSWTMPDPAVRFLMLQSAPLIVPYRINASLSAKVY